MRRLALPGLLLSCGLLAQTAPTRSPPTASPLLLPKFTVTVPAKTASILDFFDGRLFFPNDPAPNPGLVPLPESRTPAQLEAMLAAYVGTWRGEGTAYHVSTRQTLRYPVELIYKFEQTQDRRVLVCTGTYQLIGGPQLLHERLWVEKGRIVAELTEGRLKQSFAAHSNGQNLIWYSTDSLDALLSYSQTETLRFTADGTLLSSQGFEIQRNPFGPPALVYQTTDLKQVKN